MASFNFALSIISIYSNIGSGGKNCNGSNYFHLFLKKVLTLGNQVCILLVDVSNNANVNRTEEKMATPQIEATIEIPTIETFNVAGNHTKEYAIEMAKINNEEDDWTKQI